MASYIDLNDLGSFASINALWAAHPEGGQEGDYCTIAGVKYRWDKYDRMWVADPNFGPTPARSVTTFDGDVIMQNNLTVAGYIRAKGIKQPCLGLYLSEVALKAKWPDPEVGMWALVGEEFPATVYVCETDGEWTETEATAGPDDVDLSSIVINGIKGWVAINSISDLPSEPTEDEKSKGYLLGTTLYIWDSTEEVFKSAELKGADGAPGPQGPAGADGHDGVDLGLATIVDNLTEGGSTNVLSAEQGKVLNERLEPVESTLEISSSSAEVSERIGYVQNIGYIAGQTPGANGQYRYSDPIFLKVGDSLKMKAITPTNIWRLSSYNPTTQKYTKILDGESSGTSSASNAYENTYTATDDIYVVVCWYWNFFQLELTKTYNKTTTTSKVDDVDAISDALDLESATETKTEDLTYTEKVGGYGGSTAGKQASFSAGYTLYRATDDFLLKQGDTLQITAKNVATNVALLVTLDGTLYRTVIVGNNSTQSESYTAPVDGYYAVTWNASQGVTLKVTTTRTTTESERIANIEASTTQIPSLAESVADLEDAVFENVSDDMTTDFVDGYYINHNGVPDGNSSFGYKEFIVKAGAVIQGQVYSHGNIANLAKKIDTGIYEELVAGTSQNYESFSYTAPENMTIAVTFTKNKDRSITIDTDNVESNTINIENILSGMDAINKRAETPDYGIFFDKVAVIGDSLTVGTLDGLTGGHAAGGSYNCSWLTYLAKKWGSTIRMHYGRGGTTCYGWIGSNDYGLGLMLKDSVVYDVYFVAYGHNDAGGFTIGTTSDTPTTVTVDADNNVSVDTPAASTTFLGNYKKIVNEIREKAPNALIFLVSTDSKDSTTAGTAGYMNQYIEELAEWYYEQGDHRVFYIGYSNKLNIANETAGYHTGGHFSTFGYAYVATKINECVNEVIYANLSSVEIKEWGKFIGAGYRTTEIDETKSGSYLPHL